LKDPAKPGWAATILSEFEGLASRFNTVHEAASHPDPFIGQQMGTLAIRISRAGLVDAGYNDAIGRAAANGAQLTIWLDARDEAVRQTERA